MSLPYGEIAVVKAGAVVLWSHRFLLFPRVSRLDALLPILEAWQAFQQSSTQIAHTQSDLSSAKIDFPL